LSKAALVLRGDEKRAILEQELGFGKKATRKKKSFWLKQDKQ